MWMTAELPRIGERNSMATHVPTADIRDMLEPFHVHYEVCPYYVISEHFPVGGPPTSERVHAGFDINLYWVVATPQFPLLRSDAAHTAVSYFESAAQEIQSTAGQSCTIEVTPFTTSVVVNPQEQFQSEGMLRIRISHARGVGRPEGPSEELALKTTEALLRELGIKRK
jgi:hypothetical protein